MLVMTPVGLLGDIQVGSSTTSSTYANRMVLEGSGVNYGVTVMASGTNGTLQFYTGGDTAANERMHITKTGNVGIGTTSRVPNSIIEASSGSPVLTIGAPAPPAADSFSMARRISINRSMRRRALYYCWQITEATRTDKPWPQMNWGSCNLAAPIPHRRTTKAGVIKATSPNVTHGSASGHYDISNDGFWNFADRMTILQTATSHRHHNASRKSRNRQCWSQRHTLLEWNLLDHTWRRRIAIFGFEFRFQFKL